MPLKTPFTPEEIAAKREAAKKRLTECMARRQEDKRKQQFEDRKQARGHARQSRMGTNRFKAAIEEERNTVRIVHQREEESILDGCARFRLAKVDGCISNLPGLRKF